MMRPQITHKFTALAAAVLSVSLLAACSEPDPTPAPAESMSEMSPGESLPEMSPDESAPDSSMPVDPLAEADVVISLVDTEFTSDDDDFEISEDDEVRVLTIEVGDVVEFRNDDDVPHTATHDVDVEAGESPMFDFVIETGQMMKYLFTAPGTYEVYCKLHPETTMTIVVEED